MPQQHLSKAARAKINALDPDFIAGNSPFSSNDVTSRSSLINVTGHQKYWMKRNPNAVGKSTGNRKKRSS
jgi:RNA-binding protein NOB1